jgi:adenylate kinase family enzyme
MQQEIKLGTRRKDIAHELMSRGIILPRTFLIEIIKRDMSEAIRIKNVQGFIFSDYPVTLPQAKTFIKKVIYNSLITFWDAIILNYIYLL